MENVVSNFVGGALFAMLLIGIFSAADFIYVHLPLQPFNRRLLAITTVPVCAAAFSCFAYYTSGLFFELLPTRVDVLLAAPGSGSTSPKSVNSTPGKSSERPFSFAADLALKANVSWISPHGKLLLSSKFEPGASPRIEVRAVGRCTSVDQVLALDLSTDPWIQELDVNTFEVRGDAGPTDFFTVIPADSATRFKLQTGAVATFNLDEGDSPKGIKVTQFVDEQASVELSGQRELKLFIGMPLVTAQEKETRLAPRSLTLRIGKTTRYLRFWPPKDIRETPEKRECGVLSDMTYTAAAVEHIDVERSEIVLGLLITITQPATVKSFPKDVIGVSVNSSGGWLALSGLLANDLKYQHLGNLRMLQVRGNISDLTLDDAAHPARNVETYTAIGDFQAEFVQGKLRFFGKANRLWKDQGRLNATKWEKLSWEPKLAAITFFLSALGFFAAATMRRLSKNDDFRWLL